MLLESTRIDVYKIDMITNIVEVNVYLKTVIHYFRYRFKEFCVLYNIKLPNIFMNFVFTSIIFNK